MNSVPGQSSKGGENARSAGVWGGFVEKALVGIRFPGGRGWRKVDPYMM